ncbi:uncharacterized protein LOC107035733 [Diachasma alloeum]|uniref:uncharacterized protein LOC107035733 n=1 Tax=Diachasma alloeum TaxID=454923 RepID=UPI000738347D|nr:uncharacterized protein LOC107035733 [Diachasma alloeum]
MFAVNMKWIILYMLSLCLLVNSKPLESTESSSEVIRGDQGDSKVTRTMEIENLIPSLSDDDVSDDAKEIVNEKSTVEFANIQPTVNPSPPSSSPPPPNPLLALLQPLIKNIQFSPQKFWSDRLKQLRETLASYGITVPNNFGFNQTSLGRQLGSNGLFHVAGLSDDGFYTDRLEPAGFFSGNGWFANKGGLLGGPGAIFSTGSILTDYPTPYKK